MLGQLALYLRLVSDIAWTLYVQHFTDTASFNYNKNCLTAKHAQTLYVALAMDSTLVTQNKPI